MKDKIIFVDCETGGLDPHKHSLLTIAFVLWENFTVVDGIELFVNDGINKYDEDALFINQINIDEHNRKAMKSIEVLNKMDLFLRQYFKPNEKITLAGHNINFDVNFLKNFMLRNKRSFNMYFSHRYIDTSSILYYLYLAGKIPTKSISSDEAFRLFSIKIEKRHSALGDAKGTAELFSKLIKLFKKIKINFANEEELSLFDSHIDENLKNIVVHYLKSGSKSISYLQNILNEYLRENNISNYGLYSVLREMIDEKLLINEDSDLYVDSLISLNNNQLLNRYNKK